MPQKKMSIRDLAGCRINDYEQKLYDQLLPYDWDDIYRSFKEEMISRMGSGHTNPLILFGIVLFVPPIMA